MACKIYKKILGYEICILEKEGTLFYNDPIVLIRKRDFTEIYNLQKHNHETGDIIKNPATKQAIYDYIEDHIDDIYDYLESRVK